MVNFIQGLIVNCVADLKIVIELSGHHNLICSKLLGFTSHELNGSDSGPTLQTSLQHRHFRLGLAIII